MIDGTKIIVVNAKNEHCIEETPSLSTHIIETADDFVTHLSNELPWHILIPLLLKKNNGFVSSLKNNGFDDVNAIKRISDKSESNGKLYCYDDDFRCLTEIALNKQEKYFAEKVAGGIGLVLTGVTDRAIKKNFPNFFTHIKDAKMKVAKLAKDRKEKERVRLEKKRAKEIEKAKNLLAELNRGVKQ